ncbi:MAG: PH domain-containing protein [Bacteroidota bacterium]
MSQHFSAPWSSKLKLLTGAFVAICVAVGVLTEGWLSLIPYGIIVLTAAFAVRGYSVTDGHLLIHRLGWANRVDLAEIEHANHAPGVTVGSVRTFGIGGAFGFIGYFRNAVLGAYQAYVTDTANAVVLQLPEKTIVVTPERPAEFVAAIEAGQGQP